MDRLPDRIADEAQLEAQLAAPYDETVELMTRLPGDVMLLGAGGKIGPSLAHLAINAVRAAGVEKRIVAVSRFSDSAQKERLEALGVETIVADLFDSDSLAGLPDVANVIYMVGRKFGKRGTEPAMWRVNSVLPADAARRFPGANFLVYSTGCVYGMVSSESGGSRENDRLDTLGEYAWSCVARERVFKSFACEKRMRGLFYRLNYAIDLRYGVLVDIALAVKAGQPVDLSVPYVNMIWQGDANNRALLSIERTKTPMAPLNVTGPEKLSVRRLAEQFAERLGVEVKFQGTDSGLAYLADASRSIDWFGPPRVSVEQMIDWTADWIASGGRTLGKPTMFHVVDGRYLT